MMDGTAQSSKSSTLSTDNDMPSLEDADPKPKPDAVVVIVDNYIPHSGCEQTQRETAGGPHVADDSEIQGRSMEADRKAVSQPLTIHDRVRRRKIRFRRYEYKREVFAAWMTCLGRGYTANCRPRDAPQLPRNAWAVASEQASESITEQAPYRIIGPAPDPRWKYGGGPRYEQLCEYSLACNREYRERLRREEEERRQEWLTLNRQRTTPIDAPQTTSPCSFYRFMREEEERRHVLRERLGVASNVQQ